MRNFKWNECSEQYWVIMNLFGRITIILVYNLLNTTDLALNALCQYLRNVR